MPSGRKTRPERHARGLTAGFSAAKLQAAGTDWTALDLAHVPPEILLDIATGGPDDAGRPGELERTTKMAKKVEIKWLSQPEDHDYPAALSYLSLLYDEAKATTCVDKLKLASVSQFKAKDIFRASGLSLLGISNAHVEKDQQKIQAGARYRRSCW